MCDFTEELGFVDQMENLEDGVECLMGELPTSITRQL